MILVAQPDAAAPLGPEPVLGPCKEEGTQWSPSLCVSAVGCAVQAHGKQVAVLRTHHGLVAMLLCRGCAAYGLSVNRPLYPYTRPPRGPKALWAVMLILLWLQGTTSWFSSIPVLGVFWLAELGVAWRGLLVAYCALMSLA